LRVLELRPSVRRTEPKWPPRLLLLFLSITFLGGGSARADIPSLVILRPLAGILLAIAAYHLQWAHVRKFRFLCGYAVAVLGGILIYLVPLPPSLWQSLPARALATEAARTAGEAVYWQPLSLVPTGTRNALYSLLVPLCTLSLAIQTRTTLRQRIPLLFLIAGLASIVLGIVQMVGPPGGALSFYPLSTDFAPVGLFANRNHQAVFLACLLPLAAWFGSRLGQKFGPWHDLGFCALALLLAVPTILISGSRAGLLLSLVGLCLMPWVRETKAPWPPRLRAYGLVGSGFVVAMAIGIIWMHEATGFGRLIHSGGSDRRFEAWGPIAHETIAQFPVGAGWGGFVQAFQVVEPYRLLQLTYLNHAHNDWLETVFTGGLAGLLLLIAATIGWSVATARIARGPAGSRALKRVGAAIIFMLGLASVFDYPLRVPSLQCLFVIAAVWLADEGQAILTRRVRQQHEGERPVGEKA